MKNVGGLKLLMMHSLLLSRGYDCEEYTYEDIVNMSNPSVNTCQLDLYIKVIKMLAEGKSYDEISEFITNYNSNSYNLLEEKQKIYVKSRLRKDLINRKISLRKGEDK